MRVDPQQLFCGSALVAILALCLVACVEKGSRSDKSEKLAYPQAERQAVTDDYFGVKVPDPYRWLEEMDNDATGHWVTAQNELSIPFLTGNPRYQEIKERATQLWNFPTYGVPYKEGGRYFFEKNDGLQAQSVLYVTEELHGEPRALVDPNTFSEDGTVSVSDYKASRDGRWLAYSVSDGGTDWDVWHILEIETSELLSEEIRWTKFTSVSWAADSSGFFYSRYPLADDGKGDGSQQVAVYFHVPGTPQEEDRPVFSLAGIPEEKTRNPYATATEDGNYLVLGIWEGYEANGLYIMDLSSPDAHVTRLLDDWDALYYYLGNRGSLFFFQTTNGAPRGRVVAIDLEHPERDSWREVVPEAQETLEEASLVGGRIVAEYLRDAHALVTIFEPDGSLVGEADLPGLGTVDGFDGRADDPETFYSFESFLSPPVIFRFDVAATVSEPFRSPEVDFDADGYETRQVFVASRDGTQLPMFLTHRKGLELTGAHRTLLYGYGGFNVSKTPKYKTPWRVWLELGGVLADANLRGGGEYGDQWHEAGTGCRSRMSLTTSSRLPSG